MNSGDNKSKQTSTSPPPTEDVAPAPSAAAAAGGPSSSSSASPVPVVVVSNPPQGLKEPFSAPVRSSCPPGPGPSSSSPSPFGNASRGVEWLNRVRQRQQSLSPALVSAKLSAVSLRQHSVAKVVSRASKLSRANAANTSVLLGGMREVFTSPCPGAARACSERVQQQMVVLQQQVANLDNVEADEISAPAVETEDTASDLEALLEQLRVEPTNEDDLTARFGLYEMYAETVQGLRAEVFGLWEESKPLFEGGPAGAKVERQLKAIDSEQNLGVEFTEQVWFVYEMASKAYANGRLLSALTREIHTKVELLGQLGDCPICLDPMDTLTRPAQTLPCCHKVCKECWENWQEVRYGHAVCPLCRQDAFLEAIFGEV